MQPARHELGARLRRLASRLAIPLALAGTAPLVGAAPQTVVYVDANNTGYTGTCTTVGAGTSWATAFQDLQDALCLTSTGGPWEIWVVGGPAILYQPSVPAGRSATFALRSGVALYGGFEGWETARNQRDPAANETTLSGDLGNNDLPHFGGIRTDNAYHVVTASGVDATAVLDGFTVRGGEANGASIQGAGVYSAFGGPTLTNCLLHDNRAAGQGGGAHFAGAATPTLVDCTFRENSALNGAGLAVVNTNANPVTASGCLFEGNWGASPNANGGGIYASNSTLDLTGCDFIGNEMPWGAGMSLGSCTVALGSCKFLGNTASSAWSGGGGGGAGGAIHCRDSDLDAFNCLFSGNVSSSADGGALAIADGGVVEITNATLYGNVALAGRAGGIRVTNASNVTLQNSLLWANADATGTTEPAQISTAAGAPSTFTFRYSRVQGWTGTYTVSVSTSGATPWFFDPDGPDGVLGTRDDDLRLAAFSPCIDAGRDSYFPFGVTTDLDAAPRFVDVPAVPNTGVGTIDLGPYEAPSVPPVGSAFCFGDGSGTLCPCGNDSPTPGEGCLHSGGVGMTISASGAASVAGDTLVVDAWNCPPGNSGIFYCGTVAVNGGAGAGLFDGVQCVGGSVLRFHGIFQSDGHASDTGFVAQDPSGVYFTPGSTIHWQFWTRDVNSPSPCGTFANFSPAIAVPMGP